MSYKVIGQTADRELPILISVPHCGTNFPDDVKPQFRQDMIGSPDDTDWFVDQLYDFAPALGMTMITAVNSRWVIDLNRDPDSKPLYTDGRIITALCPATDFLGNSIYADGRREVSPEEVARRREKYFWPYHQKLQELLGGLKNRFGKVLLWDCHSIRQQVLTIQKDLFPDLILGSADGNACGEQLSSLALEKLGNKGYGLTYNHPFKGGYITRAYGNPSQNVHALQLEMTKVNYMDDSQTRYSKERADKIRLRLRDTLLSLAEKILS